MLHCRSISHQNAPLAIREQLAFDEDRKVEWLMQLKNIEVVLLATCNRLELYADTTSNAEMDDLWERLLAVKFLSSEVVAPYTVKVANYEAANHLFGVAASLKSMALGEAQILGQVIHAFELAQQCGTCGQALSMLFRTAIHTARRIHVETPIHQGHVSVSSLGISRVEQLIGSLKQQPVLVIGAGEMGQAVIKGLDRRQAEDVTLVSRTYETARQVAETWHIKASPITHLKQLLTDIKVVFTTSSAPFPILNVDDIVPVMAERQHDLYLVDIAMPRDVALEVGHIPGVHLYNLDDLQQVVDENWQERYNAVPFAQHIIEEELVKYWNEVEGRAVAPTIRQLREQVEHIREAELTRMVKRLGEENEELRALLEEFSHRFMNKVLHQPTQNLKVKASQGNGALFAAVARDLFGLD